MKAFRVFVISLVVLTVSGLPGLAQTAKAKPKISMEQARKIAVAKEPGAVQSSELEKEKGRLIYSFDIKTAGGIHEVQVDAFSGKIVEDTIEDPAAEAKEKQQDARKKSK
jgi:hypothetical protein